MFISNQFIRTKVKTHPNKLVNCSMGLNQISYIEYDIHFLEKRKISWFFLDVAFTMLKLFPVVIFCSHISS